MLKTEQQKRLGWQMFEAIDLRGFGTKYDPTVMKGYSPTGQNTTLENGVISPRGGSEVVGATSVAITPITSQWTYTKKGGTSIEMRAYDTKVEYKHPDTLVWTLLQDNFTAAQVFGYATQNNVADASTSYVWFCNKVEAMKRWTGVTAQYSSDNGVDQITVLGATSLSSLGFQDQLSLGDATTRFDITNPSGTTFRYTFDGTGTDPLITTNIVVGMRLWLGAQNFSAGNNGIFIVTAVSTNYFEVTNAAGVAENDKTIGTGFIYYDLKGIVVNSTTIYYKTLSAETFMGCNTVPAGAVSGDPLTQSANDVLRAPKGNILMTDNIRLFVSGVTNSENTLFWSQIDDATVWTSASGTFGAAGRALITEGGGGITGVAKDEKTIYIYKVNLVKTLSFTTDSLMKPDGTSISVEVPTINPLKSYDGKSQLSGSINPKAVFSNGNGIFFLTNNKELMFLTRLEQIDYPQQLPISDIIKPTFFVADFTYAVGIVFRQKAYLACKQTSNSSANDTVFVYDIVNQRWEEPIVGWYVADFNVFNNELHWGSSLNPVSYRAIDQKTDSTLGYTAVWRSWQEDFGSKYLQKMCEGIYIEGYILDNTTLYISVLFDENGFSGKKTYTISTADNSIIFSAVNYNPFGVNPFGFERFGANPDLSGLKKFRTIIPFKANIEFYNAQIQFTSENAGDDWEILRWGWNLLENSMPENKNIMTNNPASL